MPATATVLLLGTVAASFVQLTMCYFTIKDCETKPRGTRIHVTAKYTSLTDRPEESKVVEIECLDGREIVVAKCFPEEPFLEKNGRWYIVDCYRDKAPTISPSYSANVCHSPGKVGKARPPSMPDVEFDVEFQCNEGDLTIKACKPAGFEKWIAENNKETISVATKQLEFKCLAKKEPDVKSKFLLDACRAAKGATLPVPVLGSKTEQVNVIFECDGSEIKTCKPDRFTIKGAVKAGEGDTFNSGKQYILCKKFDMPCIGAKTDCEKK